MKTEKTDAPVKEQKTFEQALSELINCYSIENGSDTPDFILAKYIEGCLNNVAKLIKRRDRWYGFKSLSKTINQPL